MTPGKGADTRKKPLTLASGLGFKQKRSGYGYSTL
jgi:hypothetical protein